jgi:hypothetical protein
MPKAPIIGPAATFWDRPPLREIGEPNADPIYLAVGKALSHWERAEQGFAAVFQILIETRSGAAARAYGSITNSAGRRQALRSAAEVTYAEKNIDGAERSEFRELMTHFEKASSRRDDIAHGIVMLETVSGADGELIQPARWLLLVPDYNTSRTLAFPQDKSDVFWDRGKYRYNSADIVAFEEKFTALTEWVFDYATRISSAIADAVSRPSP